MITWPIVAIIMGAFLFPRAEHIKRRKDDMQIRLCDLNLEVVFRINSRFQWVQKYKH